MQQFFTCYAYHAITQGGQPSQGEHGIPGPRTIPLQFLRQPISRSWIFISSEVRRSPPRNTKKKIEKWGSKPWYSDGTLK